MGNTIEKFIDYVIKYNENIKLICQTKYQIEIAFNNGAEPTFSDELSKEYKLTKNLIDTLTTPKEEWKKRQVNFDSFEELSEFLEKTQFKSKEKFEIICHILERNLASFNNSAIILDYDKIKKYKPKSMSSIEFEDFMYNGEFLKVIRKDENDLTEEERNLRNGIYEIIINNDYYVSSTIAQKSIKKHYFDKINEFTLKDIKFIIKSMKVLKISDKLLNGFEIILKNKINQREKRTEIYHGSKKIENKKFSEREYYKTFREIETYYNIQEQKAIKPLTLKEVIYLVSLMYRINISEKEIIKCIQTINRSGLEAYDNILVKFREYYPKMVHCSETPEIKKALETIMEYTLELENILKSGSQNSPDYYFWKNEIEEEFKNVTPELNKDYTFELENGRKSN